MSKLSSQKFKSLTTKRQHKHAAFLLKALFEKSSDDEELYREFESILELPQLTFSDKEILDRIHLHEEAAGKPFSLQFKVRTKDKESKTPPLCIDIYLENLRSMHNIGAILRTTEAFRLGTIYLSKHLPKEAYEKIAKTAMGAEKYIEIKEAPDLSKLKRPFIAIETADGATSCNDFNFPESFTLLFGNEHYGLSDETLLLADHVIEIPLYGNKNSLNVASAFAILANCIRSR